MPNNLTTDGTEINRNGKRKGEAETEVAKRVRDAQGIYGVIQIRPDSHFNAEGQRNLWIGLRDWTRFFDGHR